MKKLINWKLFFILLAACVIASFLVMPYTLALTGNQTILTPVLLLASGIQSLIIFALAIFIGLLLSKKTGLGLPIIEGLLEGKNQKNKFKSILLPSVILGLIAGVLIILLDILFGSISVEMAEVETKIAPWMALLATFYGGIAEEVLCRLFLVTLFAWITTLIKKSKDGNPTNTGIWISIVLAAVLFGLGHLPATSQITPLTTVIVIRAILLNGAGAMIFGWLYWKKGLESAMIAHFSADIVLHIIAPFIVSLIM